MPPMTAADHVDTPAPVTTAPVSSAPVSSAPVRALEPVPAVPDVLGADVPDPACDCVTVGVDEGRACVVRLNGLIGREGIVRIDAVLDAVAAMSRPVVVDLSGARTRNRRLWRVLADLVARRRDAGRSVVLAGVHPDVVPDLEEASLPETFLVFQAVCADPA